MQSTLLKQALTGLAIMTLSAGLPAAHNDHKKQEQHEHSDSFTFAMIGDVPYGVAPGVLFMMQANPVLEVDCALPAGDDLTAARAGFTEIIEALERRALEFAKPVVLAHGDSHYFRVDKPGLVENGFIANFTRAENFGAGNVHWVEVSVDPASDESFSFQPMIIEANR